MAWKIRFYSGLNQGAEVSLGEGRVALGSDPLQADLVLLDEGIAAVHLVLEVDAQGVRLLEWAEGGEGRYLIEDDYDSEFRLAGRPIPTLQSIDRAGKVIYLNSFTKSIAPAIRISYLVLPPELMEEFRHRLGFYACTVPSFEQYTLARFLSRGYFEKHINRMKK